MYLYTYKQKIRRSISFMANLARGALHLFITFKLNVIPLSGRTKRFLKLQRLLFFVKYEYKKCPSNSKIIFFPLFHKILMERKFLTNFCLNFFPLLKEFFTMITQPHKKKKMSKPTDQTIYTLCF